MNRVKKLSTELLNQYPDKFNVDFQHNKKIIDEIAEVRSKELRNQIAGYIASYINKQTKEQNKNVEEIVDDTSWLGKLKLITLKLLGSIKKYCGKDNIIINENEIELSDIFSVLEQNISNSKLINEENLLILINGADLSVCSTGTKIMNGDIVTVANLIHGG